MDEVLDALYSGYGEISPFNKDGVDQGKIWEDDEYLRREFPKLDFFTDCAIIEASVKKEGVKKEEEQEKKQQEQKEEAVPVRIAKATASEVKADKESVQALGLWPVLCMIGGVVGFLVMMWGLKGGKSMGKGK